MRRSTSVRSTRRGSRCSRRRRATSSCRTSSAFEFGGRSFGRNSQDRVSNNGRPFFSRNIGLVQGRPVSLIVGDKLSGQFGGFDVGAFSVLTDETPTGEGGQILSVARVTHPIFAESKFGFVVTNGDPTGLTENTVAGVDFQYRNSNVFGDKVLQADVYYMKSFSSTWRRRRVGGARDQLPERAVGRRFPLQADRRQLPAGARLREPHVDPAICRHGHAPDALSGTPISTRSNSAPNFEFVTDLNDVLESREHDVLVRFGSRIGDQATIRRDPIVRVRAGAVLPAAERAGASGRIRVEQFRRAACARSRGG